MQKALCTACLLYTSGTMRRGKTEAEDLAIEEKLINDEKELAEHNMLVDLGRNDLGKIAKFGSVKVEALHMLQRFSHVIHITSTVSGDIQDGKDALDAIGATSVSYTHLDLMSAGAIVRTAFCGPCFGAGDTPNNTGLSGRHATRNFPNRCV